MGGLHLRPRRYACCACSAKYSRAPVEASSMVTCSRRYGEIWGDIGEIMGRYGEIWPWKGDTHVRVAREQLEHLGRCGGDIAEI